MISSFVSGITLGFGAAVPLGPINILIMTNALRSYKGAVAVGLGAMSADIIYFTTLYYAGSSLAKNQRLSTAFALFGALFLTFIAYQIFKGRNKAIVEIQSNTKLTDLAKNYIKGLSLTLLNPYTIGFWLSVTTLISTANLNPLITILGIISAIICWITIMPFIIHKTKHLIGQKTNYTFSLISSAIMLFFAASLLLDNFL